MEIDILQGRRVELSPLHKARSVALKTSASEQHSAAGHASKRSLSLSVKHSMNKAAGKAAEEQLAEVPAPHPGIHAPASKHASKHAQKLHAVEPAPQHVLAAAAHAHKEKSGQPLLFGKPVTQADLQGFVRSTIEKERAALESAEPAAAASKRGEKSEGKETSLAEGDGHYGHYPLHSLHSRYCADNSNWRGPFGDPCVSYAVGGDRQFWCEWDGASAGNACPRACGTCSHAALAEDAKLREERRQMLEAHFDPMEAPPTAKFPVAEYGKAQQLHASANTADAGPEEPKTVQTERADSTALLKEIVAMKKRLQGVEAATKGVEKQLQLSRAQNKEFSGRQAADDLQRFYEGKKSRDGGGEEAVKGAFGDKLKRKHSSAWGVKDLLNWFDSHDEVLKPSKAEQEKRDEEAAKRRMSDLDATKDIAKYWQTNTNALTASKKAEVAAAAARKLSDSKARHSLEEYWGKEEKRVRKLDKGKTKQAPSAGLTQYSDAAARKDLTSYLKKMVVGAEHAHDATVAAAAARRKEDGAGGAAVDSKGMSAREAANAVADFWANQPAEAVHVSWGDKKKAAQQPAQTAQSTREEQHDGSRQEADFITARTVGGAQEGGKRREQAQGAEKKGGLTKAELYREHSDGEGYSAEDLGLPTGRTAAVDVKMGRRAGTQADSDLKGYFSNMVQHARAEDDRRHGRLGWQKDAVREAAEEQRRTEQLVAGYEAHVEGQPYGYAGAPQYAPAYAAGPQGQPYAQPAALGPQVGQFGNAYQSFLRQVNTQAAGAHGAGPAVPAQGAAFITDKEAGAKMAPPPRVGPDGEGWGGGKWVKGIGASAVEGQRPAASAARPQP